jgi:hypothetical protein
MDDTARETLISRACETRRGCFRRLYQTLDNIVRLLREKGATRVTSEILDEASDMMLV